MIAVDPEDPASIEAWESSRENYSDSKIYLLETEYFFGNLAIEPKPKKKIAVFVADALANGPTAKQQRVLQFIEAHQSAIFDSIREAVYLDYKARYSVIQEVWGTDEPNFAPRIKNGDELDKIVTFADFFVHAEHENVVYFGVTLWVPWDDDGVGVLFQGNQVVDIGQQMLAMP